MSLCAKLWVRKSVGIASLGGFVAQMSLEDSRCESSMIAGGHEQLDTYEVQDHELVDLQHGIEASWIAGNLV